jgi:hypothetical protein
VSFLWSPFYKQIGVAVDLMLHVYLLVSLFSVFSIEPSSFFEINHETSVDMTFDSVPEVNVGDPVLYKGLVVGNVTRIKNTSSSIDNSNSGISLISLRLNPVNVPLSETLVGLVSSIKIPKGKVSSARSFVDLMHVTKSHTGTSSEQLRGFSSFEEFWSTSSL